MVEYSIRNTYFCVLIKWRCKLTFIFWTANPMKVPKAN